MNFEERLDRIAARHEALAQTVELLAHRQNHHDEILDRTETMMERNQKMMEKNQVLLAQMLETMNSLGRVAIAHEQRISNLEDSRN